MTASQAKELTLIAKAKTEIGHYYKLIEDAANAGKSHIKLQTKEINKYHLHILRNNGYKIDEVDSSNDYMRSEISHYIIEW